MKKTEKIYELLDSLKEHKNTIKDKINTLEGKIEELKNEISDLLNDLYDTHVAIGECEGALAEIDYIDNGNNY
jgi:predicted  nucleic acid-binding Zn-ribbon protein